MYFVLYKGIGSIEPEYVTKFKQLPAQLAGTNGKFVSIIMLLY